MELPNPNPNPNPGNVLTWFIVAIAAATSRRLGCAYSADSATASTASCRGVTSVRSNNPVEPPAAAAVTKSTTTVTTVEVGARSARSNTSGKDVIRVITCSPNTSAWTPSSLPPQSAPSHACQSKPSARAVCHHRQRIDSAQTRVRDRNTVRPRCSSGGCVSLARK